MLALIELSEIIRYQLSEGEDSELPYHHFHAGYYNSLPLLPQNLDIILLRPSNTAADPRLNRQFIWDLGMLHKRSVSTVHVTLDYPKNVQLTACTTAEAHRITSISLNYWTTRRH